MFSRSLYITTSAFIRFCKRLVSHQNPFNKNHDFDYTPGKTSPLSSSSQTALVRRPSFTLKKNIQKEKNKYEYGKKLGIFIDKKK